MTTRSKNNDWFTVDREGLAKILRRKGIEFAVFELIQNSWDEKGVTKVDVQLSEAVGKRGRAFLRIEDDAPEGFSDLGFAYTLFAESNKKQNAEQRGRFNLGEKLVLALCDWANVTTTKGTVVFDGEGRSINTKTKREHGTVFEAQIQMNTKERERVAAEITKLLPPQGIETVFNGEAIKRREPKLAFTVPELPTEVADEEGNLRRSWRACEVRVHEVGADETPFIYEMGIPVVEHDCAWHVDVQQKVPLTLDRENVPVQFLKRLRTAVFNQTHDMLTAEQATAEWTQTAVESPDVEPAAVQDYMTKRFGDKRVSFDMSDPEANHRAVAAGFTLVHGGMMSGDTWKNAREFSAITPAGKMFPTNPDGIRLFEAAEITPGMETIAAYAKRFAMETCDGTEIRVEFGKQKSREVADYGKNHTPERLQFNVTNLGKAWFNLENNRLAVDDLLIHELGHHYESNHLSDRYNNALTRIAAKAIKAVREGRL